MGDLQGRRVLVTGGSSGIGAATARALVGAGAAVALLARGRRRLEAVADDLGGVAVPADVADPAATRAAVDRAAAALGGLDALVAAAGLARPGGLATADPADWRAMVEINLLGVLHAAQAAIPHLRAAGRGDIVTVSSMSGRRLASREMGVYAATKSAVHVVSEALRRELQPDGIRVAVLAPGLVATPLLDGLDDPTAQRLRERAPETGLDADAVAATVVHVLAAPPDVVHVEVALLGLRQP
jgi:NADP-dependent 3-hydroxy acid dehydrogenase YdfG